MEELQKWWEVASIAQFCSLFRVTFNLLEFDIEDLEEGLIADGMPGGSEFLQDLIIHLLRGCCQRKGINVENWHTFLIKLLNKKLVRQQGLPNPIEEGETFSQLPIRTKVEIIHYLCLFRLDCDDVEQTMKGLDPDCLRVQSLGSDDKGNVYWYFYGTRLYKEEPTESSRKMKSWQEEWKKEQEKIVTPAKRKRGRPRKQPVKSDGESEESEEYYAYKNGMALETKSRWSVACDSLPEWQQLAQNLENSRSACEKSLWKMITNDFLPILQEMYEQKTKRIKKKMMEFTPRRSSSRLEVKKLHKDDEERLAAIVAADEFEVYCERQSTSEEIALRRKRVSRERARRLEERHRLSGRNYTDYEGLGRGDASENDIYLQDDSSFSTQTSFDGMNDSEGFYSKVRDVFTAVKLHKDAWPFLNPVEESYAPGYNEIIENPVAISTMESKLQQGMYTDIFQVDKDFEKMVDNCRIYNGEKSVYSTMANALWKHFRKTTSKVELTSQADFDPLYKMPHLQEMDKSYTYSPSERMDDKSNDTADSRLRKKRRKRPPGMDAIEALAQASEQSWKNVSAKPVEPLVPQIQENFTSNSQAFPGLKISPIQSHPPSLIAKYVSSASCDSVGSDSFMYSSSSRSPESCHNNEVSGFRLSPNHPLAALSNNYNRQSNSSPPIQNNQQMESLENSCTEMNSNISGISCSKINTTSDCNNFSKHYENNHLSSSGIQQTQLSGFENSDLSNQLNNSYVLSKMLSLSGTGKETRAGTSSPGIVSANDCTTVASRGSNNSPLTIYGDKTHSRLQFIASSSETMPNVNIASPQSVHGSNLNIMTVDASILGINVNSEDFSQGNDQPCNSRSSSNSGNEKSNPSSPLSSELMFNNSFQNTENSIQDALMGLNSDIAKTVNDLNRLKQTHLSNFENSEHSILGSSEVPSSPIMSDSSSLHENSAIHNTLSPKILEATVDPSNVFASFLYSKVDVPESISIRPNSVDIPKTSGNGQALGSNSNSFLAGLLPTAGQCQPYSLSLPATTNLPLQLPLLHRQSPTFVPSAIPYTVNSERHLQMSIPVTTSSCPVAFISSQPLLTAPIPLSLSSVTTDSPVAPRLQVQTALPSSNVDSCTIPPKYQTHELEHSQDNMVQNSSLKMGSPAMSNRSSPESPSSNFLPQSPKNYQQVTQAALSRENVLNLLTTQSNFYVNNPSNTSISNMQGQYVVSAQRNPQVFTTSAVDMNTQMGTKVTSFSNMSRPSYVFSTQSPQVFTTSVVDMNAQIGTKFMGETPKNSVIMSHPQRKPTIMNGMPSISYNAACGNETIRLHGPAATNNPVATNGASYNTVFAHSLPSLTTPIQNGSVLLSGMHSNVLNSKSTLNNGLPVTNRNNQQFTIVSALKSGIPSHITSAAGQSLLHPNPAVIRQPTDTKTELNNIPSSSTPGPLIHRFLTPGVQQRVPQLNTSGLPSGASQFISLPQFILPQQAMSPQNLAPNIVPHANQSYQLNQNFQFVNPSLSFVDESNRQGVPGSRTVQFHTATTTPTSN